MKQYFDSIDGKEVHSYILENEFLRVKLIDYGARIVELFVKEAQVDVVAGFEKVDSYITQNYYVGASVGRVANRIGKGVFQLQGNTYHVVQNNGDNSLHGGSVGFDKVMYEASKTQNQISFKRLSLHMEEGYPGNLEVCITYSLQGDRLCFDVMYRSDMDTICSITNHSYFNLSGHQSTSALDNEIQIHADMYSEVDVQGLSQKLPQKVEGTPFDFRQFKKIGQDIQMDHVQLQNGNGYDHNYVLVGEGLRHVASARSNNLQMQVYTTMPCMHFYSANYLDAKGGKEGVHYVPRSSFCFETQYYPNAINYPQQVQPIVLANEIIKHSTQYKFSYKQEEQ